MHLHGGAVASTFTSQPEDPCSIPVWDLAAWSLHVVLILVHVLCFLLVSSHSLKTGSIGSSVTMKFP